MRGTYMLGSYHAGLGQPYELVAEIREDGQRPQFTLVERTSAEVHAALRRTHSVAVPLAALDELVPYVERRLGLSPAGTPQDADLVARYVACLTVLVEQGEREVSKITALHNDRFGRVVNWYTDAGVSHEETGSWAGTDRIHREVLLRVRPEAGGYNRTLYLEIATGDPRRSDRMLFHESYQRAGSEAEARQHTVEVQFSELDQLVAVLEARLGRPAPDTDGDPRRRLVAAFTALCEDGELGDHLPYRQNRDRVHSWYAAAGMTCRRSGPAAWHKLVELADLPNGDALSLSVDSSTPDDRPTIEFRQLYFRRSRQLETITSKVQTPLTSLDGLVAFLERRLGLPAGRGTEDRLFACLTALVQLGELGLAPVGGPQENAALVARLFSEARVPYEFTGERTHQLLATYRRQAGCHLTLNLTVDTRTAVSASGSPSARLVALRFIEHHDYSPRVADAGREYSYTATLAPTPIDLLVGTLERRLHIRAHSPDLDERLVACFRSLVDRGDLTGDLPPEANRDRVAAILHGLGEVTTDSSAWINSD